jgi:hypothetical protein
MAPLARRLCQAFPGVLAIQHLLNLNSSHELHMGRVLSQAAVSHLAHQPTVFKLDIDAGAGREIARADEAQTEFGDIHHAAGSMFQPSPAHRTDPDNQVRGIARMPALFELASVNVHRLIIGRSRRKLYKICNVFTYWSLFP